MVGDDVLGRKGGREGGRVSKRTAGTNVEHDGALGSIAKEGREAEGGEDVVRDDVLGRNGRREGGEER